MSKIAAIKVYEATDLGYDGWSLMYRDENGKAQYPKDMPLKLVEVKEYEELKRAALAYRALCACYRVGAPPPESLHKKLEKADKTLSRDSV